jgi:hypothetical protein
MQVFNFENTSKICNTRDFRMGILVKIRKSNKNQGLGRREPRETSL